MDLLRVPPWTCAGSNQEGETKEEKAANRLVFKDSSPRRRFADQTLLEQLTVRQEAAGDGARRQDETHARVAQDFAKLPLDIQRRAKATAAALSQLIHARLRF